MSRKIALIDYDTMFTRMFQTPNYDLGITYEHLYKDKNIQIRLVAVATPQELAQYEEIYIFRNLSEFPHPSSVIENYYKLPIQEFGRGFINRPDRPFMNETRYLRPNFKCYNPILNFSQQYKGHGKAWRIKPQAKFNMYDHVKLYEKIEGEYLRKDIPNFNNKRIMIHDDLNILFNTPNQLEYLREIVAKAQSLCFAPHLDISLLKDTNILEWVIKEKKLTTIRKTLLATTIGENVMWLADHLIHCKGKRTNVEVPLARRQGETEYLHMLLTMNYLNHKTKYSLYLRPLNINEALYDYPLANLACRFLSEKPFLMSFYEYLFFVGCRELKVPQTLIRTDDDTYEYIINKYGIPTTLLRLERWLKNYPEFEEYVFIGGSSKYGHIRKRTIDAIGSKTAFGERN